METKTHWKKQFNYNYLGSYSLPEGKDIILTIKKVVKESVTNTSGQKEDCTVAYFKENNDWVKPMILNKTNCKTIQQVYKTPYIEEWVNKRVQIGISKVSAFGDEVEALRIRKKEVSDSKPELIPGTQAWHGAIKFLSENGTLSKIQQKYFISNNNLEKLQNETLNS